MKFNKNQILIIALCVCLIVNALCHCNSPAYKAYKNLCYMVERAQKEHFENVNNLVMAPVTNSFAKLAKLIADNRTTLPGALHSTPVPGVGRPANVDTIVGTVFRKLPNIRICAFGGVNYVVSGSTSYKVGDSFLGSPITYIDSCSFALADGRRYTTLEGVQ